MTELHQRLDVEGMDCAACAVKVERALLSVTGVTAVRVDVLGGKVDLSYMDSVESGQLASALSAAGYHLSGRAAGGIRTRVEQGALIASLVLGAFSMTMPPQLSLAFRAGAITASGVIIVPRLIASLRLRTLDMVVLVVVATVGAMVLGDWGEASAVSSLFALSLTIERFSLKHARQSLSALAQALPSIARVNVAGQWVEMDAADVEPGQEILVGSGERVPLDGRVLTGESEFDESILTGESVPALRRVGDSLAASTVNMGGPVVLVALRPASESRYARVVREVERAQGEQAPLERLIDRFARRYTPMVIAVATVLAAWGWFSAEQSLWTYRALVVLVVACPCALVISTPVTFLAAISAAARRGILFRGGSAIESLGGSRILFVDKTGTLTSGEFTVTDVQLFGDHTADAIRFAAAAEFTHAHPIARAVAALSVPGVARPTVTEFTSTAGAGIVANVDGQAVAVGSAAHVGGHSTESLPTVDVDVPGTHVWVAVDGIPSARLTLVDATRGRVHETIERLKRSGIERVVLLSGDRQAMVDSFAQSIGISEAHGALSPLDKGNAVAAVGRGQSAFFGDGVNDAVAMARAGVGIAFEDAGGGVIVEGAGVILPAGRFEALAEAYQRARRTVAVVHANTAIALGAKAAFIVAAVLGAGSLWGAVAADTGASVVVVLNGLRLLRAKGRG